MTSKVLIINASNKEGHTMASALRNNSIEPTHSREGFQALHLIEQEKFNTIVMVCNTEDMPPIEILTLLRETKEDNDQFSVPVIIILEESEKDEYFEGSNKQNFDDYIMRPYTMDLLLRKIKLLIEMTGEEYGT